MKQLRLGNLMLDVPFFQAALSGYSDWAMRKLAKEFHCPFALTGEMLAQSVVIPKILRKDDFRPFEDEHPVGAQLLGKTPETMALAARDLVAAGYDLIDLNYACPAPKVLRRGRGGALLLNPDLAIDILRAVREAVDCPVMIKLRVGNDHDPQRQACFWEIVERTLVEGVDALVIHGRTVHEKYRGVADWSLLKRVKQTFPNATIVGSGDVFDATETLTRLEETGLDGFIAARGAIGNPWFFQELRALFAGCPLPASPDLSEQKEVMLHHLGMVLELYPAAKGIGYFRKYAIGYARRHPQRKKTQMALMKAKTAEELRQTIGVCYP